MAEDVMWIDADGMSVDLNDGEHTFALVERMGDVVPPFEAVFEETPLTAGARVRRMKTKVREALLPIVVIENDRASLLERLRTLAYALNMERGEGKLRILSADGKLRELRCLYVSGLDVKDDGFSWREMRLKFRAADPYWYSTEPKTTTITSSGSATEGSAFPVTFPAALARRLSFASPVTLNNGGDVEAWPEWTITGPVKNLTLRNLTTGKTLEIKPVKAAAGETIVVKTAPDEKTARRGTGVKLIERITRGSELWSLKKGANSVGIEIGEVESGAKVEVSFLERFLSC